MNKKIVGVILIIVMLFICPIFNVCDVQNKENKNNIDFQTNESLINIKNVKKTKKTNQDVISNLNNQINKYREIRETLVQKSTDDEKISNIDEIINEFNRMIFEYETYMNSEDNIEPLTLNNDTTAYEISYTLVVNYFISKNYNLSAELLTHMKTNKEYNSIYHPIMIDNIKNSPLYNQIVYNNDRNGSGCFESSDLESMQDLHYSINKFNFSKSSSNKCIVISDLYDFDSSLDYIGAEKTAVNMMTAAQNGGFLTPYYILIEIENDENINAEECVESINVNDWKYKEFKTTIGKLETSYFSINFSQSGNKLIQTFSSKDTFIILCDENDNMLTFDNNSGYIKNACINYNFESNKNYILKVTFQEDDEMGNVKISITSNNSIKKFDEITKITRTSNLFNYYYDDIVVNSIKGNTNLYTLTPANSDKFDLYTDKVENYIDTYMIFIDPRNSEVFNQYQKKDLKDLSDDEKREKNNLLTTIIDDDSGDNYQSKILIGKHDTNTPYIIIVSRFGFYGANATFKLRINGMKSKKFNIVV